MNETLSMGLHPKDERPFTRMENNLVSPSDLDYRVWFIEVAMRNQVPVIVFHSHLLLLESSSCSHARKVKSEHLFFCWQNFSMLEKVKSEHLFFYWQKFLNAIKSKKWTSLFLLTKLLNALFSVDKTSQC